LITSRSPLFGRRFFYSVNLSDAPLEIEEIRPRPCLPLAQIPDDISEARIIERGHLFRIRLLPVDAGVRFQERRVGRLKDRENCFFNQEI
jgi:hypothetical protein